MGCDSTLVPNATELEKQFEFVNSLIERHRSAAVTAVNTEALQMNWEIGQFISLQLSTARWGTNVVGELADYLKRQNPKRRGFGKRHLYNMVKFYETYSSDSFRMVISDLRLPEFVQSSIAQIDLPLKSDKYRPMVNILQWASRSTWMS